MANLTFRTFLEISKKLGEGVGDGGADVFDLFIPDIDLPGFVDLPALLLLAAKGVDNEKNFITLNAPAGVVGQSYEDAKDENYFVAPILQNSSSTWIPQIARVAKGKLKAANNVLGIHSRHEDGEPVSNRDDFSVGRIFLVYFGSL